MAVLQLLIVSFVLAIVGNLLRVRTRVVRSQGERRWNVVAMLLGALALIAVFCSFLKKMPGGLDSILVSSAMWFAIAGFVTSSYCSHLSRKE